MDESTLLRLLSEINEKLDGLGEIKDFKNDLKIIKSELNSLNMKMNNVENELRKNNIKEEIQSGFDDVKYHIDAAQVKIIKSARVASDNVTHIKDK